MLLSLSLSSIRLLARIPIPPFYHNPIGSALCGVWRSNKFSNSSIPYSLTAEPIVRYSTNGWRYGNHVSILTEHRGVTHAVSPSCIAYPSNSTACHLSILLPRTLLLSAYLDLISQHFYSILKHRYKFYSLLREKNCNIPIKFRHFSLLGRYRKMRQIRCFNVAIFLAKLFRLPSKYSS